MFNKFRRDMGRIFLGEPTKAFSMNSYQFTPLGEAIADGWISHLRLNGLYIASSRSGSEPKMQHSDETGMQNIEFVGGVIVFPTRVKVKAEDKGNLLLKQKMWERRRSNSAENMVSERLVRSVIDALGSAAKFSIGNRLEGSLNIIPEKIYTQYSVTVDLWGVAPKAFFELVGKLAAELNNETIFVVNFDDGMRYLASTTDLRWWNGKRRKAR